MARPRKIPTVQRSRQIIFRVTAEEYEALAARAARAGVTVNELARRLACAGGIPAVSYRRLDPAFISRIDRIGHDLNQLVKRAPAFGGGSPLPPGLCERIERIVSEALEDPP